MVEEAYNRHATDEIEQFIEKELTHWRTKILSQFCEIIMRVTANFEESLTRPDYNKISELKVLINMDIPNLDGNINAESIDNWLQQLEY